MKKIVGEAVLDGVPEAIAHATLVLRVEDCSRADAPAIKVFEHRIGGISRPAGNADPLQFAFSLPADAPPSASWSLRAQLCRDPEGVLQQGDYVSVRRYALANVLGGATLRIALQRLV
jgi:hypothetical protein